MTGEQLAIIPSEPRLTARQAAALDFLRSCETDGTTGTELGTHKQAHPLYRKSTGLELFRALKHKGLARQKKGGIWVAAQPDAEADVRKHPAMSDEIPY